MSARRARTEDLMRELGYAFTNRALLDNALTHGSTGEVGAGFAFQRQEFLGDRVLGLVIADMLFERFGEAEEGELAPRFNDLVRRETVAEIARAIGLGRHLVVGPGEDRAGGRDKDAILADACEALLAAVYLDGGIEAARGVVARLWSTRLEAQTDTPRDPKTVLQEWSQARGAGLPDYVETARDGPDHAPVFSVEVRVAGFAPAQGAGGSKREAERNAARELIEREAVDVGA